MLKVKVKFFAYFREVFGAKERELVLEDSMNLAEFLNRLAETPQQKGEIFRDGQLNPQVVVMVNGSVAAPENLSETKIEDGAVVAIFPMMGGG
ncbi:MAG: MoaD/ThiS family protein [Candidatus Aminicenantes bacterium]|nr:MoaD/ThiS family protein [Candidatus Aminicenantes bacterium]